MDNFCACAWKFSVKKCKPFLRWQLIATNLILVLWGFVWYRWCPSYDSNIVDYHPKITEDLFCDFNLFRDLTKTAYRHLSVDS